jgi:phytoene synthase
VVGLTIIHIFGFDTRSALPLAEKCGVAFQLTNILRDIREDAERGRIYLPAEDLRRFGVSEEVIGDGKNTSAFCEMIKFEVERAREWFTQGMPLIAKVDRALATDIELFSRGGQEILNAIERQNYAVLGRRPAISKTRKLALVARAALGKLLGKQR